MKMFSNLSRFTVLLLASTITLCLCEDWHKYWPGGQSTKAPLNLKCGVGLTPVNAVMNGSRDAEVGEISWEVSVQSKDGGKWAHSCGGVVINKNFVLTTAQCAGGGSNNEAFCRSEAGIVDLPKGGWARRKRQTPDTYYPGQQTPGLQYTMRTFIHPEFETTTLKNNLALLALAQPFDVDKAEGKINSICLPGKEDHSEDQLFVSGWGAIDGVIDLKPKLQVVKAQLVDCEPDAQPIDNQICVVQDLDDSVQDCAGDFGGPLFATNGNTSTLIGIYSSGNGCSLNNTAKFIDIKPYLVWIGNNSKPSYE